MEVASNPPTVALTRFKRALPYVRPHIRQLTHTLQLPAAHAEIYGGPHAEWLRDCLEYLPRLQCLIVDRLPFFDHAALVALRHPSLQWRSSHTNVSSTFDLRLLDASGCTNATSTGLTEALRHFPDLVSLDLSRTPGAKSEAVWSSLKYLPNLRLLNLQDMDLRDNDLSIIAPCIGTRVRSLNVSGNRLTDSSARLLLEYCLREAMVEERQATQGALAPVEHGNLNGNIEAFESENVLKHVHRRLTEGFVGQLAIEEARDVGITHLFLSKNEITVEGVSGLLRCQRLQVLDVGTLPLTMERPFPIRTGDAAHDIDLPGVPKLTRILLEYASTKLQFLRINYELVTSDAPTLTVPKPRAELSDGVDNNYPRHTVELEATPRPPPELACAFPEPAELLGDEVYPAELDGASFAKPMRGKSSTRGDATSRTSSSVGQTSSIKAITQSRTIGGSTAYTPEYVHVDITVDPVPHQERLDPYARMGSPDATNHLLLISPNTDHPSHQTLRSIRPRQNSTHVVEDRRARLDLRQSQEHCLHPGMLPKLHTLVLTGVPVVTTDRNVTDRLIQYIKDAGEEASIARQRAEITYTLPPGRSRAVAMREHAHSVFALRRIVLEMDIAQTAAKKISSWRAYPSYSSTEDADSEIFWKAAAHDFSFFGDEECGLPSQEPGRSLPLAAMSALQLSPDQLRDDVSPLQRNIESETRPTIDVVNEIAKFRKERKAAYTDLVELGQVEPDVDGYWPGDITIVRKPTNPRAQETDCYGNKYESGWFYR